MSNEDSAPRSTKILDSLDLAGASVPDLAHFADRHGIAVAMLEHCQRYLKRAPAFQGRFELHALERASEPDAPRVLVLRLRRDEHSWVELPSDFPTEHLLALLEPLREPS